MFLKKISPTKYLEMIQAILIKPNTISKRKSLLKLLATIFLLEIAQTKKLNFVVVAAMNVSLEL